MKSMEDSKSGEHAASVGQFDNTVIYKSLAEIFLCQAFLQATESAGLGSPPKSVGLSGFMLPL
ncbi:hypothetical protein PtrSN002B_006806 [Pyrenophora tritici-repentis]|uniref:Uncharacterized protein n=2 Tax=Pyrenophora tritici-repentis TaxID=45151 RepID=A0A2W1F3L2_9PLEO|nr:uncharacterized protein PTRG_03446 [Pyrenophora tritici-repentis Pt-1C-BFP]KAA8620529.1 hypothetical protein PtrV1_07623 [Pyrenophora tritici-repentis]EDU46284.1 predicted protein [Pyrenophora tritici-repentis Pt-1C-BFP]KAF7448679.1 hypothetical protein A1F99_080430 [Pyrenophora tritici-repentis]KAF7572402.1 hypothetical protein PtrM4_099020 [Pyrenophora tritici-repentis]KAI1516741.1 hypothetical protein Ptr86124_003678 [Pyrenophora tritici-repentis]